MNAEFYSRAVDFLAESGEALRSDEVRYSLILSIANRVSKSPHAYGREDPWFCAVKDGTNICAVAMRTPPRYLLISHFTGDLASVSEALVNAITNFSPDLPGVVGDKELTDMLAEKWCMKNQVRVTEQMSQRIYELTKVNDLLLAPGHLRLAVEADQELLIKWAIAFGKETFSIPPGWDVSNGIVDRIKDNCVYVWENRTPVSMAAKASLTLNGMRIGTVFTPPELRGKGYATSCVASLCREVLESGYKFCTLYTDLSNPISNSIYKKIGFKEVCDSVEYIFSNR